VDWLKLAVQSSSDTEIASFASIASILDLSPSKVLKEMKEFYVAKVGENLIWERGEMKFSAGLVVREWSISFNTFNGHGYRILINL